jgi:hypothetical protein
MAKVQNVQSLPWHDLFVWYDFPAEGSPPFPETRPLPHLNPGRDDAGSWGAPESDLPGPMARGYDLSKGAIIVYPLAILKNYGIDEPEAFALQQRAQMVAWLRANGDKKVKYARPRDLAKDGDDDNVEIDEVALSEIANLLESLKRAPRFITTSGQRRTTAGPYAAALAKKRGYVDSPLDYTLSAEVREPKNEAALMAEQLDENNGAGKQGYSSIGFLRNGITLLRQKPMMGETELGARIGLEDFIDPATGRTTTNRRNERQRVYRWARLANRHPALNIFDRVRMAPTTNGKSGKERKVLYVPGGYVDAGRLHKEAGQTFLGKSKTRPEPNAGRAIAATMGKEYKEGLVATPETIEAYIANTLDGVRVKSGALTAKDLEKVLERPDVFNQETTIARVLHAILTGDADWFGERSAADGVEPWNEAADGILGKSGGAVNGKADEAATGDEADEADEADASGDE